METLGIIFYLHPYSNNLLKRLVKTPKLYFYDTGLSFKVIEKYESNELGKRCESKYVTADLNSGKICSEQTEDEDRKSTRLNSSHSV